VITVALVCTGTTVATARADEPAPPPFAVAVVDGDTMRLRAADDYEHKGRRLQHAGIALIVVGAVVDLAVTGLVVAEATQCPSLSSSCGGPYNAALPGMEVLHAAAVGVGIPLLVVGKSRLATAKRMRAGFAAVPVVDPNGVLGAKLSATLTF
jgi:hypothetical protein